MLVVAVVVLLSRFSGLVVPVDGPTAVLRGVALGVGVDGPTSLSPSLLRSVALPVGGKMGLATDFRRCGEPSKDATPAAT